MSTGIRRSLLDAPVFTTRVDGARAQLTLPGVLAALQGREVDGFEALRAHQEQAWFCFLVQVAALAFEAEAQVRDLDEAGWRARLVALTEGEESAWAMVVDDPSRPAFLQPPFPADAPPLKDVETTPDGLDMLVTAKNHDLKAARIRFAGSEHWAYALVTLQTLEGFGGRSNYGIARMNSGFGSRPMVAWAPGLGWSERFRADLGVLVASAASVCAEREVPPDAHRLLWMLPWDGNTSLSLARLHPYAVEVCRRVRLVEEQGALLARRVGTKAARVEAKEALGNVGDPWIPVVEGGKALNVQGRGFDAKLVVELLTAQTVQHRAASDVERRQGEGWFVAQAIARGQGATDGFHQRWLPVPPKARRLLRARDRRQSVAELAQARLGAVDHVRGKVLYASLKKLVSAGGDTGRSDFSVDRWTRAFQAAADDAFFPALWSALEQEDAGEAEEAWKEQLIELARVQLEAAIDGAPIPDARHYRAVSAAEGLFRGASKKFLKGRSA